MAVFLQPIFTQTVGVGGTSTITFNNIPQTFTDLQLVINGRSTASAWNDSVQLRLNGDTANNSSWRGIYAFGTGGAGPNATSNISTISLGNISAASSTSNTFGSINMYLPNYISSNFKQVIIESASEGNSASAVEMDINCGLYRSTSAISSLTLFLGSSGNFVQNSTFTLYGILRQGV